MSEENLTNLDELNLIRSASSNLDRKNGQIVSKIIVEEDSNEMKQLLQQFNLNHTKKQVVRQAVFDQLLDQITDQMSDRLTKRGDQFSNKDLLDYMNTLSASVDKSQKQMLDVDAMPIIQVNQQNNISIGEEILDRESRQRILDAVMAIKNKLKENSSDIKNSESDYVQIDDDISEDCNEIIEDEPSIDQLFNNEDSDNNV